VLKQTKSVSLISTEKLKVMESIVRIVFEFLVRIVFFFLLIIIGGVGIVLLRRLNNSFIKLIIGLLFYGYLSLCIWNIFTVQLDFTSTSNSQKISENPSPNTSPSIEMLSEGELSKRISRMENSEYSSMRFITRGGCLDEIKKQASSDNYSDDYEILANCRKNEEYCLMVYLLGEKNFELKRGASLYGRRQQCTEFGWYAGSQHSGDGQGVETIRLFNEGVSGR
jgi:hypothetical protein